MKPLVSILIPAYNAEQWVADAINSALNQTWPNKEIIIVDDGSSDETLRVAGGFASTNVCVAPQENQGAPAARNNAFSRCQGHYIQWLDADDLLSVDKIERQMTVADESGDRKALISCGWAYFRYRVSKARFVPSPLWEDLDPVEWIIRKCSGNHHMQTATWLVSRELTEAAGPWDTRLMSDDDGEYFCRVLLASKGVRFVRDSKVFYRITDSDRWGNIGRSDEKIDAQFLGMQLQIGYLLRIADNPGTRAACVNYLKTWLPNFYPERPDIVNEARALAQTLGGDLELPRVDWKYAWIEKLCGPQIRKEVQSCYNRSKSWALSTWDRLFYLMENPRPQVGVRR